MSADDERRCQACLDVKSRDDFGVTQGRSYRACFDCMDDGREPLPFGETARLTCPCGRTFVGMPYMIRCARCYGSVRATTTQLHVPSRP